MTNNKKSKGGKAFKQVPFDSKQTEHFGNVQLGNFHTSNIIEIRKIFTAMFESFKCIDSYYFIVHDDSSNIHVHFILLLHCQVRLNTMVNRIAEYLNVSELAISNTKLESIVGALKYVLHRNEESIEDGKKPYEDYELMSNDSDMIIKGYLDSDSDDNVSIRLIKQLVIECDIKSDVLIKLGSDKLLRKNRYKIDTLWDDKATLMLRQDDNLPF